MKLNQVYQALDGLLLEVTTTGELSLGRGKRWPLNKGLIPHSFYNYFGTLITGHLIEGGRLMEVQLYFLYLTVTNASAVMKSFLF